jgi:hypothetical protein
MGYQPFYITNYEQDSGLENYFESFLLPEKAFPVLEDAYCWRGRVSRRQGFFLLGRLRRNLVNTALTVTGVGNYANPDVLTSVRTTIAPVISEAYAELEIGSVVITINRGLGTQTIYTDNIATPGVLTMTPGGTYTISSGSVTYCAGFPPTSPISLTFTVAPGAGATVDINCAYYPALPVMGIRTYERENINIEQTIVFDQKYAYSWDYGNNRFNELTVAGTTWQGGNDKLFWTTNYWQAGANNIFWACNFNPQPLLPGFGDPIRYYDGTTWTTFNPAIDALGGLLQQCRALLPFKGRLFAFNTWEGVSLDTSVNFPRRIRYSAVGQNPTILATSWLTTPGAGGFFDIPTDEDIVSVESLKDVILVKCERSSYKLVYTGNQTDPAIYQKINTVFGAQSTFSLVPFDDGVFAIGSLGITTDDTTSVERIDVKIPDQVFNIQTHPEKAYGIRDFVKELVYWAFTDKNLHQNPTSDIFNNQVLVFNYRNESFAKFNDSYTAFGYFQVQNPDYGFYPASVIPNETNVAAGNQQGFVGLVQKKAAPQSVLNDESLAITNVAPTGGGGAVILTVPNHNFTATGQYWVRIDGIVGTGPNNPSSLNYDATTNPVMYHVQNENSAINFGLERWNQNTYVFDNVQLGFGGTYLGGGRVTVVQNFDIKTKVFSPFYEQGQQLRAGYVDFLTDTTTYSPDPTESGQCACFEYINEGPVAINNSNVANTSSGIMGNNTVLTSAENIALIPQQANQAKIWHRFYLPTIEQNFQLELLMTNQQMSSQIINDNDYVLHAMTLYVNPTGRMIQ